jgi:hypothetical protein
MDRKLLGAFYSDDKTVDVTKASGIFPKGGPRQGSWLDIRDAIAGMNFSGSINVIEVGVINIPDSIMSTEIRG